MKKWVTNLLIGIFAAVFLISGGYLVYYYVDAWEQEAKYDELASIVDQLRQERPTIPTPTTPTTGETVPGETVPADTEPQPTVPSTVQVEDPETGKLIDVLYEYSEIYKLNNDLVGWMTIPGTNVDYPVMQSPVYDKDYYLYRTFYKKWKNCGSLYVRETCDVFEPSDNLTIYGHNMRNSGTMFHQLLDYDEKSFWESHQYIQFDTISERHTYQIFAVFKTSANTGEGFAYHLFEDADTEAEFNTFVNTCKELSFYDTGISATFGDKLITLSTCEYTLDNGRFVVVAKRIS